MAVPFRTVRETIERSFPPACAYDWDNSGVILDTGRDITGILTALDLTSDVLGEAIRLGCELVFTHHPIIFREIRSLSVEDPVTSLVIRAAAQGISIYAAHTSADCAENGLNYELASVLGLKDIRTFLPAADRPGGLGAVGTLPAPLDENGLADAVKKLLGTPAVRMGTVTGSFKEIAVVSGSAGECWADARAQGIKAIVVGEAKHNHFTEADEAGILLIAAGHYETEHMFTGLAVRSLERLKEAYPELMLYRYDGGAPSVIR